MGRKRWEKNARNRAKAEFDKQWADTQTQLVKQGEYLDKLNKEIQAATPEEAEAIKRRMLGEVHQDDV